MNKMNLMLNDRVKIMNTNSPIDGLTGTNYGMSSQHIVDFYIIVLDEPLPTNKAITLPESCLVKI